MNSTESALLIFRRTVRSKDQALYGDHAPSSVRDLVLATKLFLGFCRNSVQELFPKGSTESVDSRGKSLYFT